MIEYCAQLVRRGSKRGSNQVCEVEMTRKNTHTNVTDSEVGSIFSPHPN